MSRSKFFDAIRPTFPRGVLSSAQVAALEFLLDKSAKLPRYQRAYVLATAFHETGGAIAPNVENLNYTSVARIRAVWPSRFPTDASARAFVRNPKALGNKVYNGRMGNASGSNDGFTYRGRGQVHLTGRENYARAGRELGLNLIGHPDLALDLEVSTSILVLGMQDGWFTGRKLSDYRIGQFTAMRAIVNGSDSATKIAALAASFEAALVASSDAKPEKAQSGGGIMAAIISALSKLLGAK